MAELNLEWLILCLEESRLLYRNRKDIPELLRILHRKAGVEVPGTLLSDRMECIAASN